MTKLEIIEETYNYYTENSKRRAIDKKKKCVYKNEIGDMCAFGRCMKPDADFSYRGGVNDLVEDMKLSSLDDILKEEYRGHDLDFWDAIQTFHDNGYHWGSKGITNGGEEYYKNLKESYAHN